MISSNAHAILMDNKIYVAFATFGYCWLHLISINNFAIYLLQSLQENLSRSITETFI